MSKTLQTQPQDASQWNDTQKVVLTAIKQAEEGVSQLQKMARASGITRKFTLDGRLVGDIGELIVARHFEIVENERPKGHAHDLYAMIDSRKLGVQVKLRREARTGKLDFKYQPEVLIVIEFKPDWSQWRIVFHGSGCVVNGKDVTVGESFRLMRGTDPASLGLSLEQLRRSHQHEAFSKVALKLKCHA